MNNILFTIPEVISLIGVFQCVYVLVYVSFRAGKAIRVVLPVLYFFVLGLAFFTDLSRSYISALTDYYDAINWSMWALGTPLSVLLIIQMAHIMKLPSIFNWIVLLVVPVAYYFSIQITYYVEPNCEQYVRCSDFYTWLHISGAIGGTASLLIIWFHRNLFDDILKQKAGKERYWLILSLIIVNICFLLLSIFQATTEDLEFNVAILRSVLGLGFVYLVSTSLFRIYPVSLFSPRKRRDMESLTDDDKAILKKIEDLLRYEKIYHEATYSRTDLAQELGVSEAILSRIININFKKSFPQLLNEYRVEDAKSLLLETDVNVKVISQEVGFNSLPSFNRVFKDLVGQSPSQYRKYTVK